MKSNFEFLESHFPVLANFGRLAEKYLYSNSNSCLIKLGMIGETIANLCFTYDRIPLPADNTAVNRINSLLREGMIPRDLSEVFHALRINRNKAVHENYASVSDGKALLQWHMVCVSGLCRPTGIGTIKTSHLFCRLKYLSLSSGTNRVNRHRKRS